MLHLLISSNSTIGQLRVNGDKPFGARDATPDNPATIDQASVDTGTSLIWLSEGPVKNYWSTVDKAIVNAEGYWQAPCDAKLPDLGIYIGDSGKDPKDERWVKIPGDHLRFGQPLEGNFCIGGLQKVQKPGQVNILGALFLNSYYGIFDQTTDPARFGWAPIKV